MRRADGKGRRRSRRPSRLSTTTPRPPVRRIRALLLMVLICALPVAGGFAYWSGTGGGSATTVLPDLQHLTFTPGTPTAQLYPGGSASVEIIASNPNTYFVAIPSLVLATDVGQPFAVDAGHSACDVSSLSYTTQTNGGPGWSVPPKVGSTNGTLTIDLPLALHMTAAAANACQGATFTVRLQAPV